MISMMFVGFKGVFLVSVEVFLGFLLVPKVGVFVGLEWCVLGVVSLGVFVGFPLVFCWFLLLFLLV